jgi:hypothetical protein
MFSEFVKMLKAYANGEGGEFEFSFTWWEVGAILAVLVTLIWVVCR